MNRKWIYILLIAALCVTAFCFVAIIFQIYLPSDLPGNFIAAFLEAVITAIIMVVLLKGQTDAGEIKERNVKVFEIKMPLFQKYIDEIWAILERREITAKKYREMTELFYHKIMLYLPKKSIENISKKLIELGNCVGKKQSDIYSILDDCTFSIVNELVKNIGLGGRIDKEIHSRMEEKIYLLLFRQTVKEALDNVLVNYSDYCLLNRGVYQQKKDGNEYIVFPFLNGFPSGCEIVIGPFSNKKDTDIIFQLYIPRYVNKGIATALYPPESETESDDHSYNRHSVRLIASYMMEKEKERGRIMKVMIDSWVYPLKISKPLNDSCLVELEQEDCYNDYIPSFSFDDRDSCAPYRRNYAEIAFALGQRVKYMYLHAIVYPMPIYLHDYIAALVGMVGGDIYNHLPYTQDENGNLVYEED